MSHRETLGDRVERERVGVAGDPVPDHEYGDESGARPVPDDVDPGADADDSAGTDVEQGDGRSFPDPELHRATYEAHEAAPVEPGDEVVVTAGAGTGDALPLRYEVRSISPPDGLSPRNEYVLRVFHPDPPYMADGVRDSRLCEQQRRGEWWHVPDDGASDGPAVDAERGP
jgi:hypothetical protein